MKNYKTSEKIKILTRVLLISFMASCSLTSCFVKKANNQFTTQQQKKIKINNMKKVLIIGMDPRTIDFTNPELPKGLTIEAIEQGTKATLEKLISIGYDTDLFLI